MGSLATAPWSRGTTHRLRGHRCEKEPERRSRRNHPFLSLLALRPEPDLDRSAVALGAAGLVAVLVLLLLLATQGRDRPWHLARGAVLVRGRGVIYYLQLVDGLRP